MPPGCLKYVTANLLETDSQPISAGDDREHQQDKDDQQDGATAATQAGAAAESHLGLKPAK